MTSRDEFQEWDAKWGGMDPKEKNGYLAVGLMALHMYMEGAAGQAGKDPESFDFHGMLAILDAHPLKHVGLKIHALCTFFFMGLANATRANKAPKFLTRMMEAVTGLVCIESAHGLVYGKPAMDVLSGGNTRERMEQVLRDHEKENQKTEEEEDRPPVDPNDPGRN